MPENHDARDVVERFFQDQIDTVPHLEALLLLWESRPAQWSVDNVSKRLFTPAVAAQRILGDLVRRALVAVTPGATETWHYGSESDRDRLMVSLQAIYRRELIRVSKSIHSKPSAAVCEFARAFRLRKDNE